MPESDIEDACVKWAQANRWLSFKFEVPGYCGWPDRLFLKDGVAVFVEFKAPGNEPRALQAYYLQKLREQHFLAEWCDNFEDFKKILKKSGA